MLCGITGSNGVLGNRLTKFKNINFVNFKGDITNKKQVYNWIKKNKFDIFIHLAAIVPVTEVNKNYNYAKKVNFLGTKYILDALIKYQNMNLKWFFFPSTSHVYKFNKRKKIKENGKLNPISKYGKTKLIAEKYINKKSKVIEFNYCIGRIFSFTDKKQKVPFLVPSLRKKISSSKKKLILDNLNHYRDFISIKDLCRAIVFLSKKKYQGTINLASGKKILIESIASKINKNKKLIFNKNKKVTYLIANIAKLKKLGFKNKYNSLEDIYYK